MYEEFAPLSRAVAFILYTTTSATSPEHNEERVGRLCERKSATLSSFMKFIVFLPSPFFPPATPSRNVLSEQFCLEACFRSTLYELVCWKHTVNTVRVL